MDTLLLFWEAIVVDRKKKEEFGILLIDFEKPYNRVGWDFLHGTL